MRRRTTTTCRSSGLARSTTLGTDMPRQARTGRRRVLFAAIAVFGAGSAMAQTPGGTAREALEREFPGVGVLERGERVSAAFGRPMTTGATAREAMEDWMDLYQPVFGVERLEWVESRGAEISNGRIAFALRQEVTIEGGILTGPTALPVEGGRLRALVAPDGEDFAVTYVAARVVDTDGEVAAPQITGQQAIAAAGKDERTEHLEVWSEPELVVVEMDLGTGPEVFAAWRLAGQESEVAILSSLIVYVDAVTGDVARVRSGIVPADPVTGTVTGKATSGLGPPLTTTTGTFALPDLIVSIVGEGSTTTDDAGDYELQSSSASVDVEASLDAGFWTVFDGTASNPPAMLRTAVAPPASGQDFLFITSSPSVEEVALANSYLHVQKSNDLFNQFVSTWTSQILPNLPNLEVRPNHSGIAFCNAFYIPSLVMLAFCEAIPSECNNGAFSTIVTHEYGHYVAHQVIGEEYDASADAFHEGYADSLAMYVHNTDIIGQDWILPTPSIVRQPSGATVTYPACSGGPHERGELLGRLWWDILDGIDPDPTELEAAQRLFANWTLLSNGAGAVDPSCGSNTLGQPADTGTLVEVLTADDDDGDISNGTPNYLVICQAFADRDIETQFGISPCPAPLHGGMCRADLNYDRVLDILDFLEFQIMFATGDTFCDFNGDGVLDFFDFLAFQAEYAAGCW